MINYLASVLTVTPRGVGVAVTTEPNIYSVLFVDPFARSGVRAGRIPKSVLFSSGSERLTRLLKLSLYFVSNVKQCSYTVILRNNNVYHLVRICNFVASLKIPQISGIDWTWYVYHTYFLIVLAYSL